ncbi:MAG: hypothetical protein IPM29_00815 [Planctomycetes bacterium]|nr:hypothetical protein [Planctomycetota bacterium]
MNSRSLALGAGLALVLAAVAPAQYLCSPWSKRGMRRIAWQPGSTLQLGTIDSGAASTSLSFRHDDVAGVVLTEIGHRGTRKDGTVAIYPYQTTPPDGCPPSLWMAVFRPVDSQTPVELHPDADDVVEVWVDDPADPYRAIFCWTDLDVDELCDSRFWMELRVTIDRAQPTRAEWLSRMGRIQRPRGCTQYTLDEVHAPILHVRQPGDGTFARLLVPIAQNTVLPAANLPMRLWSVIGYDVEFEHPARQQQMQFSAMFSNDPSQVSLGTEVLSSYRKILYMSTEDTSGYYKRFAHRVVSDAGTLYYRWAPIYFPVYGPTPWINVHIAQYPVVLDALEAQTDSYWFDCTERYREFVEREVRPIPIDSPWYRLNRDYPRASVFQPSSTVGAVADSVPAVFTDTTDHALLVQDAFRGADGNPTPMFMEWQKWLKGDANDSPYPGRQPEDPIGAEFNPRPYSGAFEAYQEPPRYAIDEIDRARNEGINVSVYTGPIIMNDTDWPSFDPEWFLRQRDGSLVPVGPGTTGRIVDYGYLAVPFWFATNLYDDIFDATPSLGGVFFDVVSGGGSFLRYPSDPGNLFSLRAYHGGDSYVRGVRLTVDLVRLRIALAKQSCAHPDVPFIPGETVQEGLVGHFDFGQQGLKSLPMQQQCDVLYDLLALVPTTSNEVTNPDPPLWNAVYHQYGRADGLSAPLSVYAVSPLLGGGQPAPYPGVDWNTWASYQRMTAALFWFQGMKPTVFPYYQGVEYANLLVERNGNTELRDPAIPQQGQLLTFLQRLHTSLDREPEAGRFLCTGRMERPLQTPASISPDPFVFTKLPNPGATIAAATDPTRPFLSQHFYENFFSRQPYNVPCIFHAVWRDAAGDGTLALVFANWSDLPAAWQGVLDPACYEGLDQSFTITGLRPNGTGVDTYPAGQGTGRTTLAWSPFVPGAIPLQHHASAAPGFMPPRSVQVFLLRSAP